MPTMRLARLAPILALSVAACAGESPVIDAVDQANAIDDYIRSLAFLPATPPGIAEGAVTPPTREGDYQCVRQNLTETRQYDRIVAYAANSDALWPGAIVAGESVYAGLFAQVGFERKPLTISVGLENLTGAKSARLESPSLSSYREALTTILSSELDGATPANIFSEIEEVHSDEQLALALGAEVSWLGSAGHISASFDWSSQQTRSRYLVKYTQAYYTVDLDAPARPSDFFADAVTLGDVQARLDDGNPPLYVSSITYGRMVVFTFESEYSAEEMEAALDFAYSGGVDVSGDVSVTYKDIISRSKITAYILGGSGGEAARTIDSYEALIDFIKDGGNYSRESPGAPIAYKLSYLRDNSPGRISLTTDYEVKDCERVSQKVKVTLKSIRVDSDGGDGGDNLELYGRITATGESAATLFDKGTGNYVAINEGQTWPQGAFVSEAILNVKPTGGEAIRLSLDLWDYDPISANDSMGRELVVAAFEAGWRRDVTAILTGDGARVVVTFGLQPI
jgi:thiol-activated cytolysin